jgi:hypothetical protein
VRVASGGNLIIANTPAAPSGIDISGNLIFENKPGGYSIPYGHLTVKSGGSLTLNNSKLIIGTNAQLIFEQGSKLIYNEGSSIELQGTSQLVMNGTIEVGPNAVFNTTGTGTIKVDANNEGKIVINSGGSIDLLGSSQTVEKLSIFSNGKLTIDANNNYVTFTLCKINTYSNSRFIINNPSFAEFMLVNMEGHGTAPYTTNGIEVNGGHFSGQMNFTNYANAVVIKNVSSPGYSGISHGTFTNCSRGLYVENVNNAFFDDCVFSSSTNAVYAKNGKLTLANNNISNCSKAIQIENVPDCFVSGGSYTNNQIAIDAINSALFINGGAQIEDNITGINIIGSHSKYSMVTVGQDDCGWIRNNETGILGTDVILNIDAYINKASQLDGIIKHNRFDGNSQIFKITYSFPAPVARINAKGNYWGNTTGLTPIGRGPMVKEYSILECNGFAVIKDKITSEGPSFQDDCKPVPLNAGCYTLCEPLTCTTLCQEDNVGIGAVQIGSLCVGPLVTGPTGDIVDSYYSAVRSFIEEDNTTSRSMFAPVSSIPLLYTGQGYIDARNGMPLSDDLVQMIRVAEVIMPVQKQPSALRLKAESGSIKDANFNLYPNPTNSLTNIEFTLEKDDKLTIEVMDMSGKVLLSPVKDQNFVKETTNKVSFETTTLSSGIYIIKIKSNENVEMRRFTVIK